MPTARPPLSDNRPLGFQGICPAAVADEKGWVCIPQGWEYGFRW